MNRPGQGGSIVLASLASSAPDGHTMVLAPPFCITKKEIDEMVVLARTALDKTYADVKSEM